MKICLAQISSIRGDIKKNIEKHKEYIREAIENKSDLICFPELSITGYEPNLAKELATTQSDVRFDVFQDFSDEHNITICIGVPTKSKNRIYISMIIFHPFKERQTYSKQYLHSDEIPYFIEGSEQTLIEWNDKLIAPAICYESLVPKHFKKAMEMGIDIYLVSLAKSRSGIEKANLNFNKLSKSNEIPILMVNSVGKCNNFIASGGSTIWDYNSKIVKQLAGKEGVLFVEL